MRKLTLFDESSEKPSKGILDAILDFGEMYDGDVTHLSVGSVVFKKEFGPWKKGECADCIIINYVTGVIEQYDDRGTLIRIVPVKLAIDTNRT